MVRRVHGAIRRAVPGRRLGACLLAVTCITVLAGCIVERPPGIAISNDLVEPVEITYPGDPAIPAVRLDPAETKTFTFGLGGPGIASDDACTSADIVATSLDGRVLARIPPPICHDWGRSLSSYRVP
jgi:hypothetical protein